MGGQQRRARRADARGDIGKDLQAVAFTQAQVDDPGHRDEVEDIDFGLAEDAQQLFVVLQHDRLVGVAGGNAVARMLDVL